MKIKRQDCGFCESDEATRYFPDNEHLVACKKCGLVYSLAQLSVEGMRNFYHSEYFINENAAQKGYDNYFSNHEDICKTFSRRMDMLEKYFDKPGKVLDIGCAAGFFLEVAKQRGWQVKGVDISKVCCDYAKERIGVQVENDVLVNFSGGEREYDMITMWDYLEHSITPKEDLEKAARLLKDDGLLVVATPDISSIPARMFRSGWIGIKLEEHFYYFSRQFLSGFLSKMGFDILRTGYVGKYVSGQILADRLVYYSRPVHRLLGKSIKKMKFSLYCNPFDIMLIIARKNVSGKTS